MRDPAMDVDRIVGIADEEGGTKFLFLHVELLNEFPMNETRVCSTINEACLVMLRFPWCERNSIGIVNANLFGRVVHTKRSPG